MMSGNLTSWRARDLSSHPAIAGEMSSRSMNRFLNPLLDRFPLGIFVVLALTLGLAPFLPEPHVWEKLKMLAAGTLVRPIDIVDLLWHGIAWVLLALKLVRMRRRSH
jgi:hypothetical protein